MYFQSLKCDFPEFLLNLDITITWSLLMPLEHQVPVFHTKETNLSRLKLPNQHWGIQFDVLIWYACQQPKYAYKYKENVYAKYPNKHDRYTKEIQRIFYILYVYIIC